MGDFDIFKNSNVGCRRKMLTPVEVNGTGNDNVIYCKDIILDWQWREMKAQNNPSYQFTGLTIKQMLNSAKNINRYVQHDIKYMYDIDNYGKSDFWATTDEVIKRGTDDCDGQSMVRWRKMREAGFSDNNIGMVIVYGHMLACLHLDNEDFFVLDNGYLTTWMEEASGLFPYYDRNKDKDLIPLVGFNLFDMWMYY